MSFKIIDIEQGSQPWLDMRLKYITASQIPVLFGHCPYQLLEELIVEKLTGVGKDFSGKEFVFKRGHELEDTARNILRDYNFKPAVLTSKLVPNLMASLDGFDQKLNVILEAKYVGKQKIGAIKRGVIPKNHYWQIQTQLLVSGANECLYWCSNGDKIARIMVKPNDDHFKEIIEKVFWFKELLEVRRNGKGSTLERIFDSLGEGSENAKASDQGCDEPTF